ncbi:MAG: phosphoribosyltransferase family protein [Bacteroidota bacterium]
MSDTRTLLLNSRQIRQRIQRIAHQIVEVNFEEEEVIVVGIMDRGHILAERIATVLQEIAPFKVKLYSLEYDKQAPLESAYACDLDAEAARQKAVVLVDDVLNTGRTLIYAANHLLQFSLKRLTTIVMVDRRHRSYPIRADFVGLTLATTMQEHIAVELGNGEDAVYLE